MARKPTYEDLKQRIAELEEESVQRKRAEEALRQERETFLAILQNDPHGIALISKEGKYFYVNPQFTETTGYTLQDVPTGEDWFHKAYPDPEYRKTVIEAWKRERTREGRGNDFEFKITCKDGAVKDIEFRTTYLKEHSICVLTDVTQRKQAESQLLESEENAKRIAEVNIALAEIGRIVSSTLSIEDVYEQFALEVKKIIPVDRISIGLINHEQRTYSYAYTSGIDITDRNMGKTVPLPLIIGKVIRERSGILLLAEDERGFPEEYPTLSVPFRTGIRSIMFAPLPSKDEVVGALFLGSFSSKAYTERDLKLAENVAAQIAGAVASAQLYAQIKQTEELVQESESEAKSLAQENAIMAEIGRIINSSLKIEEVYERFAEEVQMLIPFDRISINLVNLEDNTISVAYFAGIETSERPIGATLPVSGSFGEYILFRRKSLLVRTEEIEEYAERFPSFGESLWAITQSLIAVPLVSKGEPVGILYLRTTKPDSYSERDLRLADRVGYHITSAVANSLLFAEHVRAEEALRQSENRAQSQRLALADLAENDPIRSGDLQALTRVLAEAASNAIRVERASVWLLTADGKGLNCVDLFEATSRKHSQGQVLKSEDYPHYFEAVRSQIRVAAEDARTDPRTSEFTQNYLTPLGITSMLDAAVFLDGELAGVVCLEHIGEKRKWHPDEESFASTIASLMGQAMANAARKFAEEVLRESEERYRDLYDEAPVGYHEIDTLGRITRVNRQETQMLGYSAEEMLGQPVWNLVADQDARDSREMIRAKLAGLKPPSKGLERRYRRKDGTTVPALIDDTIKRDGEGRITGIRSTIQDVTERKRAEEALRESEEKFRSLVETTSDWIWEVDSEGVYTYTSPRVRDLLGCEPEEVLGRSFFDFMPSDEASRMMEAFAGIAKERRPFTGIENVNVHKDGRRVVLETSGVPRLDTHGNFLGYRGIDHDITDRKRAEEALRRSRDELEHRVVQRTAELEEAKVKAESANRAKSEFLANMSHELRTPLNHIMGFTELVLGKSFGELTALQEEYLNDVLQSGRHLLSLIDDILDLSKVEAGKLELDLREVDPKVLVESSLMMIGEKTLKSGIRVVHEFESLPESIRADERKLKQILYNLLSNAVKFTPNGGEIRVIVDSISEVGTRNSDLEHQGLNPSGESAIMISVSDTGIGIRKEDLERIFAPFEQVESSASRKFPGTGLGLSLTRPLVELHGGRIWAESEGEGKGSRFAFVIPVAPAP